MTAPEEEEEAAYVAERARLQGLLQRAAASAAQDRGQAGAEEDDGDDEKGEEEGVRYVRVKPCADPGEEAELHALLRTEAGAEPLPWCPPHDPHRVWALPAAFRLAPWPPYRAGRVYGMDAASAAAVWALGPQPGEHVLDLCCAPGLKLSAIADDLAGGPGAGGGGSLTGVDVSRARLAVARKVAVKYRVGRPPPTDGRGGSGGGGVDADAPGASAAGASHQPPSSLTCRLLCADGVDFALGPLAPWDGAEEDVIFDSRAYDWQGMEARGQRRMNRGTRRKELLALRALLGLGASSGDGGGAEGEGGGAGRPGLGASSSHSQQQDGVGSKLLYDRVLVDSDCTHDGSARHLAKVAGLEEQTRAGGFLSREKLAGLEALQRGLICNGFRLLRPGGVLVYSTCSLSPRQNEAVVQHLLATHPDAARLDPITELGRPRHGLGGGGGGRGDGSQEQEQEGWLPCRWGNLPGTLLFEPRFGTSGLFVARVRKGRPAGGGEEEG